MQAVSDPEPGTEWKQGPGDTPAGTVASAKRLGTARSDRGDALTADAPTRALLLWQIAHLFRSACDQMIWWGTVVAEPGYEPWRRGVSE